jgi:hypothetical protein
MFLDYFALVVLIMGVTLAIYVFFAIHDIPHHIAKKRNHPQQDAIHAACWLSLFTLHAIWPIVFIWAVSHRPKLDIEVRESDGAGGGGAGGLAHLKRMTTTINVDPSMSLAEMRHLVTAISRRIEALEREQAAEKENEQEVGHG